MQQAHEPAGVAYRLAEPDDGLAVAAARVLGQGGVLGEAVALVGGRDGEDEQQGEGGARDEAEHVGVVEAVHVVDAQLLGQAKLVEQVAHQLRVGLERDEGDAAYVARWCGLCHGGLESDSFVFCATSERFVRCCNITLQWYVVGYVPQSNCLRLRSWSSDLIPLKLCPGIQLAWGTLKLARGTKAG